VPFHIRKVLGIAEGDSLMWELDHEGKISINPQKSKTEYLASLNKRAFGDVMNAKKYLEESREEWGK
jgi:bifunctional DNA-binding transcriptional regulator/antitoxin component of YhaV-PrlF toxin-antitoxin module